MKKDKIIIGLVGQIASGKGTAAKYIEKKYKAECFRFSTILRDILNDINMEINRKNLQNLSTTLRKNFGEDLLSKNIASRITSSGSKILVVDGIRRLADIRHLIKLDGFFLLKVTSPAKIRYERLTARNENQGDDKKTYKNFLADQEREADKEIPLVMKKADHEITNNKGIKELFKQIDMLIKKLK